MIPVYYGHCVFYGLEFWSGESDVESRFGVETWSGLPSAQILDKIHRSLKVLVSDLTDF